MNCDKPEATIRRLDSEVVDRIAAGEVIQRPANAIKELIENCLDAKSNSIQIYVLGGGLKLIQVTDNGSGIRYEDLSIACERFTTSKLISYMDLNSLETFGFRGEALSSLSHVSHLTIRTRTSEDVTAFKLSYNDGKPLSDPVPCAGLQGTRITVENLFYNVPGRKIALQNTSAEYQKIYEIVRKYALHNNHVSFTLKKTEDKTDLKTVANSTISDNIRLLYDNDIAKELMEINDKDDNLKFSLNGFITNANYSTKKFVFLLFINDRLVESNKLKKAVDSAYSTYLPKTGKPFVYLNLKMDPRNLDVNVSPTKDEVIFLFESEIVDKVFSAIEKCLLTCKHSRNFSIQTKVPDIFQADTSKLIKQVAEKIDFADAPTVPSPSKRNVQDKDLNRTDPYLQKIDGFFRNSFTESPQKQIPSDALSESRQHQKNQFKETNTNLSSILELRKEIKNKYEKRIADIFTESSFVGSVNIKYILIQHKTKLFLCNVQNLLKEYFYQKILFSFQNLDLITFQEPLPVQKLLDLVPDTDGATWKNFSKANSIEMLMDFSEMLLDYFSIEIDRKDGCFKAMPQLLDNYKPEMANLPDFLIGLIKRVDWGDEKRCLDHIAKELASYYADLSESNLIENANWKWLAEFIIYPEFKGRFYPSMSLIHNASILQIADLPNLYSIFERC